MGGVIMILINDRPCPKSQTSTDSKHQDLLPSTSSYIHLPSLYEQPRRPSSTRRTRPCNLRLRQASNPVGSAGTRISPYLTTTNNLVATFDPTTSQRNGQRYRVSTLGFEDLHTVRPTEGRLPLNKSDSVGLSGVNGVTNIPQKPDSPLLPGKTRLGTAS
jgi:hypothetical protein